MKVKKGCYVSARDSRCIKREISSSTNSATAELKKTGIDISIFAKRRVV